LYLYTFIIIIIIIIIKQAFPYAGLQKQPQIPLTSALDIGQWLASRPHRFTTEKKEHSMHIKEG